MLGLIWVLKVCEKWLFLIQHSAETCDWNRSGWGFYICTFFCESGENRKRSRCLMMKCPDGHYLSFLIWVFKSHSQSHSNYMVPYPFFCMPPAICDAPVLQRQSEVLDVVQQLHFHSATSHTPWCASNTSLSSVINRCRAGWRLSTPSVAGAAHTCTHSSSLAVIDRPTRREMFLLGATFTSPAISGGGFPY